MSIRNKVARAAAGSPLTDRPDDRPEFLQQLTRFLFSRLERQSVTFIPFGITLHITKRSIQVNGI